MEQQLPLKDIHLPDAISWWPPAIGWWILVSLLIALGAFLIFWSLRKIKQGQYRKAALKELEQQHAKYNQHGDSSQYIAQLNQLLRRVALQCYGRNTVAHLSGEAWISFLQQHCPEKKFDNSIVTELVNAAYIAKPAVADDTKTIDARTQMTRLWIKHHRRPA